MSEILFVSKPIAPPWRDSGKNLVRDLARSLTRHRATVMGVAGVSPDAGGARCEAIYAPGRDRYAPALADNAKVLFRLFSGPRLDLWHFFFAPNPRSSMLGKAASGLRRQRTVHTVASAPRDGARADRVFFADVTVVLSAHTRERVRTMGLSESRVRIIPPAIEPLAKVSEEEKQTARGLLGLPRSVPIVIFPGDLEFGGGARVTVDAVRAAETKDVHLVIACRPKTEQARAHEGELRRYAEEKGVRCTFVGETPHIHAFLAASDVVVLPSASLYAKMDYPLVLLEAMSIGRPVIVAHGTPAAELAEGGGAIAVAPSAEEVGAALDRLLGDPSDARMLGARAAEVVEARFSLPAMATAYEALYDALGSR